MSAKHAHFHDKDAIDHIAEKKAAGLIASEEVHGTEIPGHISAAADAARETAILLLLLSILFAHFQVPLYSAATLLGLVAGGWIIWKTGRSAWLGWSQLERLHRIVAQEKWEIEHHRPQEREELRVLYAAKGVEGKLLEDLLDVLMADSDRLLRVMVQEELGLTLESREHPLKQSLGAFIGSLSAGLFCLAALLLFGEWGLVSAAFITVGIAGGVAAYFERNDMIPSVVWNMAIAFLAFGFLYFLFPYFSR